jgi:L-malate glycosyltransferase
MRGKFAFGGHRPSDGSEDDRPAHFGSPDKVAGVATLHQLIPRAAPYDAIAAEALAIRDTLRDLGYDSAVFAENVAPGMRRDVSPLARLTVEDGAPILLHYCVWSDVAELAVRARGPVIVRYQGVTPPHWFEGVNDVLADECRRGRARLSLLVPHTALAIAASQFTRQELVEAGFGQTAVLPVLLPHGRDVDGRASRTSPLVVTIGRIAPNKRIDEVLRVFALFQRVCRPDAALSIVGTGGGSDAYERACKRLAGRLGVRNVDFAGNVTDEAKEALLRHASAYISLSEHEGFGIPIVEAMRQGVPILARAAGAVPETVGEGGLVVETRDYAELAELLDLLVSDTPVRAAVLAGQQRALRRFEPAAVRKQLEALLTSALRSG